MSMKRRLLNYLSAVAILAGLGATALMAFGAWRLQADGTRAFTLWGYEIDGLAPLVDRRVTLPLVRYLGVPAASLFNLLAIMALYTQLMAFAYRRSRRARGVEAL